MDLYTVLSRDPAEIRSLTCNVKSLNRVYHGKLCLRSILVHSSREYLTIMYFKFGTKVLCARNYRTHRSVLRRFTVAKGSKRRLILGQGRSHKCCLSDVCAVEGQNSSKVLLTPTSRKLLGGVVAKTRLAMSSGL